MYPRWHSEDPGLPPSPPRTGENGLGQTRQDLFEEPLPDLEQQLSAELNGASWVVVAFAPEDGAWCDWIYRCLNGYPLPTCLVDHVNRHGFPIPDCLSVFPDRLDPSYEEHTGQALENSPYLIVVCSPESVQSAPVDDALRIFKKIGGEERIIALVVDSQPDVRLGERLRAPNIDWLPSWLRWRCDEKGFSQGEGGEPRVVDARRGFASMRQVRDGLIAVLADLEAPTLERLGAFKRELPDLPGPPTLTPLPMPQPTLSADITAPTQESGSHRDAAFMIGTALVLIVVAVIFGIKSFRELSADEPQSALTMKPRTTPRQSRSSEPGGLASEPVAPVTLATNPPEATEKQGSVAEVPSAVPSVPAFAVNVPAPQETIPSEPKVVISESASQVEQVAPPQVFATTKLQPQSSPAVMPPSAEPVPVALPRVPSTSGSASGSTDDSVLLDEVRTLERRGDETMAERRTEDALDLYTTALSSALEYANRKGANPAAKDHVVMLQRKLGMLQVQNASTAEARATYQQARKTLLQLKAQGQWSRERAKALDELESRLMSLPRD